MPITEHTSDAVVCLQDGLEVKSGKEMKRVLGLFELWAYGISAIIGGGIFVVTGIQAKTNAG
jgi:amino acid transporter